MITRRDFSRFFDGIRFPSDNDKSQEAGPVVTYKLSPEEIEKRYGKLEKINKKPKLINLYPGNPNYPKREEKKMDERVEKIKLTKKLLEEYINRFGVEKFDEEHIEQIAQETSNLKRIVALQAGRSGFYKSHKSKKETVDNSVENKEKAVEKPVDKEEQTPCKNCARLEELEKELEELRAKVKGIGKFLSNHRHQVGPGHYSEKAVGQ